MLMKRVLFLLTVLLCEARALGEGGYYPPDWMIAQSDFIAVISVRSVEELEKTEKPRWYFGQLARATVERTVKGELPKEIEIYAGENFVCQQTYFQPGRFLVFLNRDQNGKLHASNYQMSARPIKSSTVEWYFRTDPDDPFGYKMVWKRLDRIIRQIVTAKPTPAT